MTSRKKKKELKGSKTLVSPAGTASCFGYKRVMLKITIVQHAEGLRSQWQEATTKSPECSPTEDDSSVEKDPRKAKEKATLANEWDVKWGRPVRMRLSSQHLPPPPPPAPAISSRAGHPSSRRHTLADSQECGDPGKLKLMKEENSAVNFDYFILMHF